jgi:hypothetical protein
VSISCPIERCDRTMPGTSQICGACTGQLGRALADVPWLAAQLQVSLSRQASRSAGGRSATVPLPFDERAGEAAWVLRSALVGWVHILAPGVVPLSPICHACGHLSCELIRLGDWPADTLQAMARWLWHRHDGLSRHPAAVEAHDEITSAVRQAERAIDRRAERWYAGPCDCGQDMYARPGAIRVTCPDCDSWYDVAARRAYLLGAAEDTLAGAALIAQSLTSLGQPVTPERLRQWAHRGRIVPHGTDLRGRPMYRVGDVITLLAGERLSA